jgi:ferredoxin
MATAGLRKVFVAVCGEPRVRAQLGEVGRRLEASDDGLVFEQVDGLCSDLNAISERVTGAAARRLVLGLCPGEFSPTEVQRFARRARVDPFGVQVPDLRSWRDMFPAPAAVSGAATALLAAVARARAFKGSLPEQSKAVLSDLSEAVSRRAFFRFPAVRYAPVPAIDSGACVAANGCTQCVRTCPHGALSADGGAVRVDRSACKSCGFCVTACPQRAVDLPGYAAHEIEAQVGALTGEDRSLPIVFACRSASRPPAPGWQTVHVACAGMVPASALLAAIARGAQEVGVYRCTSNCANSAADRLAGTVDYCRQVLLTAGESPDRVRLLPPGDEVRSESPSARMDRSGRTLKANAAMELFGAGASGRAVLEIARSTPGAPVIIDHTSSPLGLPEINPDACTACGTCSSACPAGAIHQTDGSDETVIVVDPARCIGCGDCVSSCPERNRGAISVSTTTDVARIAAGPRVQFRATGVGCRVCGRVFTTREVLGRLRTMLGDDYREDPLGTLCPDCRGR